MPSEACMLCGAGAERSIPYPGAQSSAARALELRDIAICTGCGFGRALPCPDQPTLDRFYASGSYWHGSTNPYQLAHERVQARVRVRRCLPLLPPRELRVLDIGAGHGFIADALREVARIAAYDFIEPDDSAARRIKGRRLRSIEEAAQYDVLFLNHVLEHVADPQSFMRGLVRHLEPGALGYVETPFSDHRFKADVFPHVLFFTPEAFGQLGRRLGVQTLAVEAFGRMQGPALAQKVADVAFRIAVRTGILPLEEAIDRAIWGYRVARDGVWVRWLFRRGSSAG